jgi:SWI/SNF-related matrix-associated actin-dependent regulator of chromatin subfamily A-like protein 1
MANLETPFPYQIEGAKYVAGKQQALLADEMGLGKSCQAVLGADLVGAESILVVCPAAVRINWGREFERFSPMDRNCAVLVSGKDRPIQPGVTVVSYDLLASNEKLRKELKCMKWDVLILDEAHYLKERSAKRTKAIYGHNSKVPGIAGSAARVWRLSGTPAPNDASELYTHLRSAGLYQRSYWDFVFEFCDGFDTNYGYKITGVNVKNVERLKALLAQFMIRRMKEEVMSQLPPISFHHVVVERTQVELDPYFYENWRPVGVKAFLQDMEAKDRTLKAAVATVRSVSNGYKADDVIKVLESLSTSTATLRRYIAMAKLPRCIEVIKGELESGQLDKIVIFAIHKDVIEGARKAFAKWGAVTLYGGTPAEKRQANIDRFMKDPKCRVFIGNIQAAGTGITLTSAHEVAFFEQDWVPANNAQAAMRVHRIGQTKHVRCRVFSCAGSVDEDIAKTLVNKTRELSKVFD